MTTVVLCIQHWLGKAPSSFQDSVTARSTSLDKSKKRSSTCEEFRGVFETFPLLHQTRRGVFWLRTCRSPYTQAQRCRIAHAIGEVLDALDGLGVLWLGGPSSLSLYLQVTLSVSISIAGGDSLEEITWVSWMINSCSKQLTMCHFWTEFQMEYSWLI